MKHVEYKVVNDKEEPEQNKQEIQNQGQEKAEIKIAGPLVFWIMMLCIGLFSIIISDLNLIQNNIAVLLLEIGKAIIYIPGAIILPLIVSLWVAERIGSVKRSSKSILTLSLINTAYVFLVYVIAIFIVFMLVNYINSNIISITSNSFLIYLVALPCIILFVLVPLLSQLSSARHNV